MHQPWIVLVGLVVLAALLGSFTKKRRSRADPLKERWPLEPKSHLLTERERVLQLSVDFVVVRRDTSIVAAIELDDASHDRTDRREADARKTHALNSAGIQLVRWQARSLPDLPAIAAALIHRP
jgi:LPXTG-motif cell wall-anchored protein